MNKQHLSTPEIRINTVPIKAKEMLFQKISCDSPGLFPQGSSQLHLAADTFSPTSETGATVVPLRDEEPRLAKGSTLTGLSLSLRLNHYSIMPLMPLFLLE